MKFKRLLSGAAALVMTLFAVPTIPAVASDSQSGDPLVFEGGNSADGTFKIQMDADTDTIAKDETVTVTLNITENTGVFYLQLPVEWDTNKLELCGVSPDKDLFVAPKPLPKPWKTNQQYYEMVYWGDCAFVDEMGIIDTIYKLDGEGKPITSPAKYSNSGHFALCLGPLNSTENNTLTGMTFQMTFKALTDDATTANITFVGADVVGAGTGDLIIHPKLTATGVKLTLNGGSTVCTHPNLANGKVTGTPATCTENGTKDYYECPNCHERFLDATGSTPVTSDSQLVINKLNHDWNAPTYTWSADNKTCTAQRVCKRDASHKETVTVESTSEVKTPATYEAAGVTTYTATFTSPFTTQTKDVEGIPAKLDREWNAPTYQWSADKSQCTATRTAKDNAEVKETETVNSTSVTTPATCTEAGKTTYTATFTKAAFTTQTTDVTINALNHDWNAPTYTWSADNKTCTAERVCKRNASHAETKTVNSTSKVKTAATYEAAGVTTFTATFEAPFTTQTKDVEGIPAKLDREWNAPTYQWSADKSQCTATRTAKDNADLKETETVDSTSVTTPATCTEAGKTTYTAAFTKAAFTTQTTDVTIDPLNHDWDEPTYTWSADNKTCTAQRVCKRNASHKETVTVLSASEVKTPATYEAAGVTTFTATFEAPFTTQKIDVEGIPAKLDRNWNAPTYQWSADHSQCTATRTAKDDESVKETETVNAVSQVTKNATCKEDGETTYTATFTKEAFTQQVFVDSLNPAKDPNAHVAGDPVKENEVAATEDAQGSYEEVVYCTVCGAELSRETKYTDKLTVSYTVESVDWTKGSGEDALFTVHRSINDDKTFGEFVSVSVDGENVASDKFTTAEGSLKLTFLNAYLETLSVGTHNIAIAMANNKVVETTLNVKQAQNNNNENGNGENGNGGNGSNGGNDDNKNSQTGAAAGTAGAIALLVAAAAIVAKKRK